MEKLNDNVSADRLQSILNQLESQNPYELQARGEFVSTFQADMFTELRKEMLPEEEPNQNLYTPPTAEAPKLPKFRVKILNVAMENLVKVSFV